MSQKMSYDDFSRRLEELSERIAAAKSLQDSSSELEVELSQRHMHEFERRHTALQERLDQVDRHGWEQFKESLSGSLEELLLEFGHLFTDADEKFRHRK